MAKDVDHEDDDVTTPKIVKPEKSQQRPAWLQRIRRLRPSKDAELRAEELLPQVEALIEHHFPSKPPAEIGNGEQRSDRDEILSWLKTTVDSYIQAKSAYPSTFDAEARDIREEIADLASLLLGKINSAKATKWAFREQRNQKGFQLFSNSSYDQSDQSIETQLEALIKFVRFDESIAKVKRGPSTRTHISILANESLRYFETLSASDFRFNIEFIGGGTGGQAFTAPGSFFVMEIMQAIDPTISFSGVRTALRSLQTEKATRKRQNSGLSTAGKKKADPVKHKNWRDG